MLIGCACEAIFYAIQVTFLFTLHGFLKPFAGKGNLFCLSTLDTYLSTSTYSDHNIPLKPKRNLNFYPLTRTNQSKCPLMLEFPLDTWCDTWSGVQTNTTTLSTARKQRSISYQEMGFYVHTSVCFRFDKEPTVYITHHNKFPTQQKKISFPHFRTHAWIHKVG